ncbi:hypothetical protein [Geobacillus subterraneus]|uniref:Uncharacterized protein n=1 Tax=Geobacillus subterraneus TaxID=129338 RepID=A0A679FRI2_9BACL|nr:hypothetical protein [Geobacillus subterraneus]BBW98743.1 hypothetical protein GsuE55_35760 [Geobacillus subterraneus]
MLTFSINPTSQEMFEVMLKVGTPTTSREREWVGVFYLRQLNTRRGNLPEENSLGAFAYSCERNTKMMLSRKKEICLLIGEEEFEDNYRGISLEHIADENLVFDVDSLVDSIDLNMDGLIREFEELERDILIQKGINIRSVIGQALMNNKVAINRLAKLKDEFDFGDLLKKILENTTLVKVLGLKDKIKETVMVMWEQDRKLSESQLEVLMVHYENRCWA